MMGVSRRQLLPWILKMYCWVGMVGAVLLLLEVGMEWFTFGGMSFERWLFGGVAAVLLSMTGLLWAGWRWAIWYNALIGVLLIMLTIWSLVEIRTADWSFVTALLTFPYWIKLFEIRRSWR